MWKGQCVFWPIEHNVLKEFAVSFLCLSGNDSTTSIHIESVMCFVLFSIFYDEVEMLLVNSLVSKAENEHPRRMLDLIICNLISFIENKNKVRDKLVKIRVEVFD